MSSIIEKVETFIQRLHDMDYIITPEATKIIYRSQSNPLDNRLLSDLLGTAISEYEKNRNSDELRLGYAQRCLLWINKGFACGVVKESQGLARKLEECREKNAQLERDLERLSLEYLQLQELTRRMGLPDESDLERAR